MSTYLIDYENVHVNGLAGLDDKTSSDNIIIFYSANCNSLSFELHRQLGETSANIEYIKIEGTGKNSLDFQLVSYLGYLIAKDPGGEFAIISRDNGYGSVVEFWKKRKINVTIAYNLHMESKTGTLDKLIELIPQYEKDAPRILSYVEKYKTKQGVNNALMKDYGSETAGAIYKAIKPLLAEKKAR